MGESRVRDSVGRGISEKFRRLGEPWRWALVRRKAAMTLSPSMRETPGEPDRTDRGEGEMFEKNKEITTPDHYPEFRPRHWTR